MWLCCIKNIPAEILVKKKFCYLCFMKIFHWWLRALTSAMRLMFKYKFDHSLLVTRTDENIAETRSQREAQSSILFCHAVKDLPNQLLTYCTLNGKVYLYHLEPSISMTILGWLLRDIIWVTTILMVDSALELSLHNTQWASLRLRKLVE